MATYKIENSHSGVVLGEFEANSASDALDAMARTAGYADYAACCEVAPAAEGEIIVTTVAPTVANNMPTYRLEKAPNGDFHIVLPNGNFVRTTNCEFFATPNRAKAKEALAYLSQPRDGMAKRKGAQWLKSTFGAE
jgi:hypothetical protein